MAVVLEGPDASGCRVEGPVAGGRGCEILDVL